MSTSQLLDVFSSAAVFVEGLEVSFQVVGGQTTNTTGLCFFRNRGLGGWGLCKDKLPGTRSSGSYIAWGIAVTWVECCTVGKG